MNGVKCREKFRGERKYVALNKVERVVRLALNVNANHFKASLTVPHTGAACATKEIK